MKYLFRSSEWLAILALAVGSLASEAVASEPVEPFLAALRERLYFDEALDYLDLLKLNSQVPDDVKQKVLYEQGVTLLESATGQSDSQARGTQLSRASALFEEFHKSFPQHPLAASAKTQMGNILLERGRFEGPSAAARKFFEAAREPFAAAEKELDAQLQKMPKLIGPDDKDLQARKRRVSGDLAQVLLLRASIDDELAKTFEANSPEAKKHLQAAAHDYAKLYETYRTRAVGLLARLWEGRCYQKMGKIKQALGCYQELMDLHATPETREIKTKSTRHSLECWTRSDEKKYQEAIECGERWEKESGGSQTDPDALAIRYLTALAYQAQSNALPAKDPNRKKLVGYARQYVSPVAQHPGEYQRPAKMLLVALGGKKDSKDSKDSGGEPTAFSEAFERANQALERMQEATANLQAAEQGTDPAALAALRKQKSENAALAGQSLRLALNLAGSKTTLDDLNSVRWYLCFLAWDAGDYYEAAVLGEFLARRYPDSPAGRRGARVALASFVRLHGNSKADDKDFETAQIQRVADMIFQSWPNEEEADEAALTLLNFATSQHQLDKALEYLGKISTISPRRGQAELRAGQALWSAYLRSSQAPAEQRPPQEKLDSLKKQAQEVLAQGIARLEKEDEVDATLAAAVFAMAQICVDTGQPEKAILWLEHPKMGSLTLLKAGNPVATREGFATEAYKIALRAYIAVTPQQLKKAEEVMDSLEKLAQKSGDSKASDNLTTIYISLGRELQQHLQALRKSGKMKELESVSRAFEIFLDRVTLRETGGSFASLHWVGETYYSLGSGFDEGGPLLSSKANAYFRKATTAYQRMLEVAEKDPKYQAQPESLLSVRLRLAECFRRSGNFDEAIQSLVTVLRQKPMLITAQVLAAEIHQASGALDNRGYALAITGSNPGKDGKNTIWGWNKISKMTMNHPKFEETFHQSRLNMVESRYRFALSQKDKKQQVRILEAAKQDLWYTYKLHPNLGGKETLAQYDRMLKQIQKALGAPETGLAEFQERDDAAANAK